MEHALRKIPQEYGVLQLHISANENRKVKLPVK